MIRIWLTLFLMGMVFRPGLNAADAGDMKSVAVGSTAPEWEVHDWINSPPLTLESLRERVVLLRWWTGPGCPFCTASAPRLNELYRKYRGKGLVVIGFYHHKSADPLWVPAVKKLGENMGMEFPLAVDRDWRTFMKYWIYPDDDKRWTSVGFLIDQKGIIRAIHHGGEITEEDIRQWEKKISTLLKPDGKG